MPVKNSLPATRNDLGKLKKEVKDDLSQLKRELKRDITQLREEVKSDVTQLRGEFAQLRQEVKSDIALLKIDVDEKIIELEERINLLPTKDEFYEQMSKIMAELKAIREEQIVTTHRVSEQTDQLGNHEERITSLEKVSHL